jgi:DNA polymerase III psi subunit
MIESRRLAYLDAMGFDLWSAKPPEPEIDRLLLQPGEGRVLLICDGPDATATRIAADISRALAADVVWAWPDPSAGPESLTLEQAVDQYLFTRAILFGAGLGHSLFRGDAPLATGSARITVSDSLDELAVRGEAKRAFWMQISEKSVN